jgi:hypothetical protein
LDLCFSLPCGCASACQSHALGRRT